ncbi:ATP-binding protein [Methylobrevis pamukkalensis]|uniref:Putative HTH-type transcriptional regulator n=1 Tax=Methylobrevis pamukkalensis TaxID=1439726 RepID=A0A1E3H5T8_9HYPH|nr:winged helix-turn-helix domain-containing protein [Methylobrevis pamukkalensis]ODN71515.1 putative HTH-type transcriptional regulator [Methylobrevis pamukkalensis]
MTAHGFEKDLRSEPAARAPTPGGGTAAYAFGPFRLSLVRQELSRDGEPIRLGGRAIAILGALVEHHGRLLSKAELMALAWPDIFVEEGNLRVHITALRRALDDSTASPAYIVNVAGRGYQFIAPVERVVDRAGLQPALPTTGHRTSVALPRLPSRVVGREAEIAALDRLLEESRIVTVTGTGGIGKTTLALVAAHRHAAAGGSPVFFVDLSAVREADLVPYTVAAAVQVAVESHQPRESLVGRLAQMEALLVFDNCEHVIDCAAELAESLLKGAPAIRILATSHEPLRIEGERVLRLMPFELPAESAGWTLDEALHLPAVGLFVEHAQASDDTLFMGDEDVPFIVEICRRLDGLPLAIEIAAARVSVLGVAELAQRLDDRFSILLAGRRNGVPRHQTLRSMLDWSFDNLSDLDRLVLRRLSVFAAAFTLDAACQVAGDDRLAPSVVVDCVANLLRRSLLMSERREGATLFRLLDSTRLYAAEKLEEAGEAARVRRLHADYLCGLLNQAEQDWIVIDRRRWLDRYGPVVDDVRAAVGWSFSGAGDPVPGVMLTRLAVPVMLLRGLVAELRELVIAAIAKAEGLAPALPVEEMRLQVSCASLLYNQSMDYQPHIDRAMELAERIGTDRARIEPLIVLSVFNLSKGNYALALSQAETAHALGARIGDDFALLAANRVRAQAMHFVGRQDDAIAIATDVLRFPVAQIPLNYGFVHSDRRISMRVVLARALWITGYADRAKAVADEALAIAQDVDALAGAQILSLAAVPILLWRGDFEAAKPLVAELREQTTRFALGQWLDWAHLFDHVLALRDGRTSNHKPNGELASQMLATFVGDAAEPPARFEDGTWCSPELHRIRGERLIRAGDLKAGEAAIRHALELARRQQAIAWELRCAVSLVRLSRTHEIEKDAAAVLRDVLGRLPEGHRTEEPSVAQALLDAFDPLGMLAAPRRQAGRP